MDHFSPAPINDCPPLSMVSDFVSEGAGILSSDHSKPRSQLIVPKDEISDFRMKMASEVGDLFTFAGEDQLSD